MARLNRIARRNPIGAALPPASDGRTRPPRGPMSVAMECAASVTAAPMVSGWRDASAAATARATWPAAILTSPRTRHRISQGFDGAITSPAASPRCANALAACLYRDYRIVAAQLVEREVGEHEGRPRMLCIAGAQRDENRPPRCVQPTPFQPCPGGGTSDGCRTRPVPLQFQWTTSGTPAQHPRLPAARWRLPSDTPHRCPRAQHSRRRARRPHHSQFNARSPGVPAAQAPFAVPPWDCI